MRSVRTVGLELLLRSYRAASLPRYTNKHRDQLSRTAPDGSRTDSLSFICNRNCVFLFPFSRSVASSGSRARHGTKQGAQTETPKASIRRRTGRVSPPRPTVGSRWSGTEPRLKTKTIFTARRSYASTILGVVILSVRLSVCHTRAL